MHVEQEAARPSVDLRPHVADGVEVEFGRVPAARALGVNGQVAGRVALLHRRGNSVEKLKLGSTDGLPVVVPLDFDNAGSKQIVRAPTVSLEVREGQTVGVVGESGRREADAARRFPGRAHRSGVSRAHSRSVPAE